MDELIEDTIRVLRIMNRIKWIKLAIDVLKLITAFMAGNAVGGM